jgi:hypothetical protein
MVRNDRKEKEPRTRRSKALKDSAKKAAEASALKRRQQKEERERLAGDQEPVIDFDTVPEAQDQEQEVVAVEGPVEEPVEKPGQESVASQRPELDQDPENDDEPSASEDGEQKAGTEEEEPVVEQ